MLEIAGEEAQSMAMDHHGLVAAVCRDLRIAEKIDQRLSKDPQRVVSPGQAYPLENPTFQLRAI